MFSRRNFSLSALVFSSTLSSAFIAFKIAFASACSLKSELIKPFLPSSSSSSAPAVGVATLIHSKNALSIKALPRPSKRELDTMIFAFL